MNTLQVALGERSYPIYIGQHLLSCQELFVSHIHAQQVMIISNTIVAPLYLNQLLANLNKYEVAQVVLPDGEEYKTLEVLDSIFDNLLARRCDRHTTLIALGGGVVGDMTGFAAACYQRGVPFIQVPTTLLAQVDSSVGGKTGVNHRLGKNMIGAFYQPQCVIIDTETLQTLEDRQFRAGLAEVIKYGLIDDLDFFTWLEGHVDALLQHEPIPLNFAITHSCANKARIVAQDERESELGLRALLNLGHTFGHAIETGTGYGHYLHGEAVAIGLCLAAQLSGKLGWLSAAEVNRIIELIRKVQLPTQLPKGLSVEQMLELMKVDKKARAGKIRLVLLQGIGKAIVSGEYNRDLLIETLMHSYAGN